VLDFSNSSSLDSKASFDTELTSRNLSFLQIQTIGAVMIVKIAVQIVFESGLGNSIIFPTLLAGVAIYP